MLKKMAEGFVAVRGPNSICRDVLVRLAHRRAVVDIDPHVGMALTLVCRYSSIV